MGSIHARGSFSGNSCELLKNSLKLKNLYSFSPLKLSLNVKLSNLETAWDRYWNAFDNKTIPRDGLYVRKAESPPDHQHYVDRNVCIPSMDSESFELARRQLGQYPNNGGKQCDCNDEAFPQPFFNEPATVVESLISNIWEGHISLILKNVFFYVQMSRHESFLQRKYLLDILAESEDDYKGLSILKSKVH